MTNKKIMVCITQQKLCKRLIKHAFIMKKYKDDELFVIHVVKENWKYFGELKEADALEYLFESAKEYDATLSVFKAKDIESKLAEFAEKEGVDIIVMGESFEPNEQQNMINRLQSSIKKKVQFEIVPSASDIEIKK